MAKCYSRAFLLSLRGSAASTSKPGPLPGELIPEKRHYFPQRKVISLSKTPSPRPQRAGVGDAGVWKPKRAVQSPIGDDDARLFQAVRAVLNKVTPSKFDKLLVEVQAMDMATEARLAGVIEIFFDKAVSEPVFVEIYARMCHALANKCVATADGAQRLTFRMQLLRACQKEFEKDTAALQQVEAKRQLIQQRAAANATDEKVLRQELDELEAKNRRRSLGNIRLIGELFKLRVLPPVIFHKCIERLLNDADEESLEALCRLLMAAGKELDAPASAPSVDGYLQRMEGVVRDGKTSSRIRFLVQDVVELRRNKWKPRSIHTANQPKTIQQIHQEVKRERQQQEKELQKNYTVPFAKGPSRPPLTALNRQNLADLRLPRGGQINQKSDTVIRLGPGVGVTNSDWARGSSNSHVKRMPEPAETSGPVQPSNRVCAEVLANDGVKKAPEPAETRRPRLLGRAALTDEHMERKVKSLVREFLTNGKIEDVVVDLTESLCPSDGSRFVTCSLLNGVESSDAVRRAHGTIFREMIRRGYFTTEDVAQGFSRVLEDADDYLIDIPKLWSYLAESMVAIFDDDVVPFTFLASLAAAGTPQQAAPITAAFVHQLLSDATETKRSCAAPGTPHD